MDTLEMKEGEKVVVHLSMGAGGSWGSAPDLVSAATICRAEARDFAAVFGGFRDDVEKVSAAVFVLPAGTERWAMDDRGIFYSTDPEEGGEFSDEPITCRGVVSFNPHDESGEFSYVSIDNYQPSA